VLLINLAESLTTNDTKNTKEDVPDRCCFFVFFVPMVVSCRCLGYERAGSSHAFTAWCILCESFALVSQIGTGRFDLALSVPLVHEYEQILMRQAGAMGRNPEMVTNLLDYLCTVGKRQTIFYLWRPLLQDADDETVLELAVAAGCSAIITHDRRQFQPASHFRVRVPSPAEFLDEIGGIP
jgi:predicted nucleic acid-binding protein